MKILIENSSQENDIVFDLFAGISATCIGAKELKRRFLGVELDKSYFDVGVSRVKGEIK